MSRWQKWRKIRSEANAIALQSSSDDGNAMDSESDHEETADTPTYDEQNHSPDEYDSGETADPDND